LSRVRGGGGLLGKVPDYNFCPLTYHKTPTILMSISPILKGENSFPELFLKRRKIMEI
jgi:hypothetical protein